MSNKDRIWIVSDRHTTVSVPKARVETEEEFVDYQVGLFQQVKELVGDDLLLDAGDILDTGLPYKSQMIINTVVDNSPANTVFIHGNHCLHSFGAQVDLAMAKGTLGNLARTKLKYLADDTVFEWGNFVLYPFNFKEGRTLEHRGVDKTKINIAVSHFLSYPKEVPHFVIEKAVTHERILEEFPEYDYIIVGDNHSTDLTQGKYLSPGSLTRRKASQMKHKPCIWSLDKDGFHQHFLDVPEASLVLSREHLDKKEAKEGRFDDWAESVENSDIEDLDIESSLHSYFLKNKTRDNTKDLVLSLVEVVKRLYPRN